MRRTPAVARAAVLLAALLAAPAPALAEVRAGTVADASGDGPAANRDIRSVTASYDTAAGALSVAVTLGAAPTAGANLIATVGTPTASGACGFPLAALGSGTDPAEPAAVALPDADTSRQRAATRTISGPTVTLSATDPEFAGQTYACVTVDLDVAGATVDDLDAPLRLAVAAAPPPAATPPAATPQPAPPLTRAQRLARALKACRAKRGAARARCERAARARYAPPLTRAQKLARALKACRATPAGAARTRCVATARKRFGPPAANPRPGTGGTDPKAPLAGRFYYYPGNDLNFICGGVCWKGFAFVDATWVATEPPDDGGLFPACPAAGDACKRYTYDAATRTGTVAGKPFTMSADLATLTPQGDVGHALGSTFRPGGRTTLYLKGTSVVGSPYLSQTVTTLWLEMFTDGRFILSGISLGSVGGPGAAFESRFSATGPDRRGRYEFLAGGLLRLTYDDGRVSTRTAFVLDPSVTAAAKEGIAFGGTLYTPEG